MPTTKLILRNIGRHVFERTKAVIDLPKSGHVHPIGLPMEVAGWCFVDNGPAYFVEVWLDGKRLLVNQFNCHRHDVVAVYSSLTGFRTPVGFQYLIDFPPDFQTGSHTLSFFALDKGARRISMGEINFEATDFTTARSFSQRFAEIPPHLVSKVNGTLLEAEFTTIGSIVANTIEEYVGDLTHARQILDFGCGLGRVMLPLLAKLPQAEFTGFDIDPIMLKWCSYLLQDIRFKCVSSTLDLPDNTYDMIYVISVFTHLDVTAEFWLSEIQRILTPTGHAFITYIDDTLFEELVGGPELPDLPKGTRLVDRYVVGQGTLEGGAKMGTFYTTAYWESLLAKYFNVERSVPRGLFGHQSFSVATKKQIASDKLPSDREYLRTIERELFELRRATRALF